MKKSLFINILVILFVAAICPLTTFALAYATTGDADVSGKIYVGVLLLFSFFAGQVVREETVKQTIIDSLAAIVVWVILLAVLSYTSVFQIMNNIYFSLLVMFPKNSLIVNGLMYWVGPLLTLISSIIVALGRVMGDHEKFDE